MSESPNVESVSVVDAVMDLDLGLVEHDVALIAAAVEERSVDPLRAENERLRTTIECLTDALKYEGWLVSDIDSEGCPSLERWIQP